MGVLDFLFEGKPPKSVTTYGQTVENVPKWMSDYTQGLIARANAIAAEPYQAYQGPRIAGFDPAQEQAFELTEQNVGAYEPYLGGAGAATARSLEASPLEAAAPYIEAAGGTFPEAAGRYMDPYIENVLNRQETLAGRTLEEQFLPALQRSFIGAGAFGSRGRESMEELGLRGVRDISEGLEEQRLASLSGAYGQAADIYGRDVERQADLGRIAGELEARGADVGLRGGAQLGALGETAQQLGLRDAAALEAVGAERRGLPQASLDLAYQDFLRQQQYPEEQVQFMSEIIRGLPPSAVPSATTRTDVGPAAAYQPSGLAQLASAYGTYKGLTSARGGLASAADVIDLPREDYYEVPA